MSKFFDSNGKLNSELFNDILLKQTNNFQTVLEAANKTKSSTIESTHFLLALVNIANGFTEKLFLEKGITPDALKKGLQGCVRGNSKEPVKNLSTDNLHISAQNIFALLDKYINKREITHVEEGLLLLATLENLTDAVVKNLSYVELSPQELITDVKERLDKFQHFKKPEPFINNKVHLEAFTSGAILVMELMKREAESLGFSQIDPRHLLLALLEYEGGATQSAIYQQNLTPKKIQEKVIVTLRGWAKKTTSQLELATTFMHQSLIQIIEKASIEAKVDFFDKIAEVHLLRSFLTFDTFALQLFTDAGIDLILAKKSAQHFKADNEPIPVSSKTLKSIASIETELINTLVGQNDAMTMCLPFIKRMLFGFNTPGKPAGVFLFCGPSGVGKTETAKAIARAVFGSEDNLIMLEMGQFQTKESMNIFVGAPPGYIGYGEGKLTNGLRDKPCSVVLFDEVEKAHPEVFDALLRFIDEGKIDDPAGPIRDGSKCIIIMTSNIRTDGMEKLIEGDSYRKNKWKVRQQLKEMLMKSPVDRQNNSTAREPFMFRIEFLNRINEIILFRPLDENDLSTIAQRYINEFIRRLKEEKGISLSFNDKRELDSAARIIGLFCKGLTEGARAVLRVTQSAIVDPVIDFLYSNNKQPPVSLDIKVIPDETTNEPKGIVRLAENYI